MKVHVSYGFVRNKLLIFVNTIAENEDEKIYEMPVYSFFAKHIKDLQEDTDSGFQFCDYNQDIKKGILELVKYVTVQAKKNFQQFPVNVELFELVGDTL